MFRKNKEIFNLTQKVESFEKNQSEKDKEIYKLKNEVTSLKESQKELTALNDTLK